MDCERQPGSQLPVLIAIQGDLLIGFLRGIGGGSLGRDPRASCVVVPCSGHHHAHGPHHGVQGDVHHGRILHQDQEPRR